MWVVPDHTATFSKKTAKSFSPGFFFIMVAFNETHSDWTKIEGREIGPRMLMVKLEDA